MPMPINWSVWSIKPGRKGWARRYPPGSYAAAEVLKVTLMSANRDDDDVYLYIIKERAAPAQLAPRRR